MSDAQRRAALLGAVAALEADVLKLEQDAAAGRALIEQLCARAGIADEVEPEIKAAAKKRMSDGGAEKKGANVSQPSRAADKIGADGSAKVSRQDRVGKISPPGRGNKSPVRENFANGKERASDKFGAVTGVSGRTVGKDRKTIAKTTAAPAKPDQAAVEELSKVVAIITAAAGEESAITDLAKLTAAIEARYRAERRAGQLLIALAGRAKLPNISKAARKRFRAKAELLEDAFEAALRHLQRKAVAALSGGAKSEPPDKRGNGSSGGGKAKPPEEKAPGPKQKDKTAPASSPRPRMRLTDWHRDAAGVLSRTLTAEVDGAAMP
jgi:hypothetical protein